MYRWLLIVLSMLASSAFAQETRWVPKPHFMVTTMVTLRSAEKEQYALTLQGSGFFVAHGLMTYAVLPRVLLDEEMLLFAALGCQQHGCEDDLPIAAEDRFTQGGMTIETTLHLELGDKTHRVKFDDLSVDDVGEDDVVSESISEEEDFPLCFAGRNDRLALFVPTFLSEGGTVDTFRLVDVDSTGEMMVGFTDTDGTHYLNGQYWGSTVYLDGMAHPYPVGASVISTSEVRLAGIAVLPPLTEEWNSMPVAPVSEIATVAAEATKNNYCAGYARTVKLE